MKRLSTIVATFLLSLTTIFAAGEKETGHLLIYAGLMEDHAIAAVKE